MDFKIVYFKDVDRPTWNNWVNKIDEATHFHSWFHLDFASRLGSVIDHGSFICLENEATPLAVCPLAVCLNSETKEREISFIGSQLGVPALRRQKPAVRRQVLDRVFEIYSEYARSHEASRLKMIFDPLTVEYCRRTFPANTNIFEYKRYRMLCQVNNTSVIDLSLPEEVLLENLSRYHRRHIKKSAQLGMKIEVFNSQNRSDEISLFMQSYQQTHFLSAGRLTRPQGTWDSMLKSAQSGDNTLFVNFLNGTPISFLLCGEFCGMAYGWSQANLPESEVNYSPRHLLEWEAILYYKKMGYQFYEIGERYYFSELFRSPTPKEVSIGEFKERYGGFLLPRIEWNGYLSSSELTGDLEKSLKGLSGIPIGALKYSNPDGVAEVERGE